MKASEREYTGVLQFFHNYEHDPEGRTHCYGLRDNPYVIIHMNGKHVISTEFARGHGRRNTQWFHFTKKYAGGYDMAFYETVGRSDVTATGLINRSGKWKKLYKEGIAKKDHTD